MKLVRTPWLSAILFAMMATQSDAGPIISIDVYASVTDPSGLSFAPTGELFVGRDNTGSGGTSTDAVRIYRVGAGGGPVSEYGNAAISDPDAVLYDALGAISGVPGSVLVIGASSPALTQGQIVAVLPDETIVNIIGPTSAFTNPNDLIFDSTNRLLFVDRTSKLLAYDGVTLQTLTSLPSRGRKLEVDSLDRIYTITDDEILRVYSPTGSLLSATAAPGIDDIAFGNGGAFGNKLYGISDNTIFMFDDNVAAFMPIGNVSGLLSNIEFGPDHAMYISEFTGDRILRVTVVPAPSSLLLLCIGLAAILGRCCRRIVGHVRAAA